MCHVMLNTKARSSVLNTKSDIPKEANEHNYLGQALKDHKNKTEIRIIMGWNTLGRHRHILEDSYSNMLEMQDV